MPDGARTLAAWRWRLATRHALGVVAGVALDAGRGAELLDVAEAGSSVVVRRGDTLQSIAGRELGDWREWPRILDANPSPEPGTLASGQTPGHPGEAVSVLHPRIYYPRAVVPIQALLDDQVPGSAGVPTTFSAIPRNVSVERNSARRADRVRIELDYRDLPLETRMLKDIQVTSTWRACPIRAFRWGRRRSTSASSGSSTSPGRPSAPPRRRCPSRAATSRACTSTGGGGARRSL